MYYNRQTYAQNMVSSYTTSEGVANVLRVHPAPGVHILAARCKDFKPCAPGTCMYIQHYEYLYIEMCIQKDSWVHGVVFLCTRCLHRIIP